MWPGSRPSQPAGYQDPVRHECQTASSPLNLPTETKSISVVSACLARSPLERAGMGQEPLRALYLQMYGHLSPLTRKYFWCNSLARQATQPDCLKSMSGCARLTSSAPLDNAVRDHVNTSALYSPRLGSRLRDAANSTPQSPWPPSLSSARTALTDPRLHRRQTGISYAFCKSGC